MDSETLDREMCELYVMSDPFKELQDCRRELIRVQNKLIEVLLEERKKCHCSK